jgi:hypothetical protein
MDRRRRVTDVARLRREGPAAKKFREEIFAVPASAGTILG